MSLITYNLGFDVYAGLMLPGFSFLPFPSPALKYRNSFKLCLFFLSAHFIISKPFRRRGGLLSYVWVMFCCVPFNTVALEMQFSASAY